MKAWTRVGAAKVLGVQLGVRLESCSVPWRSSKGGGRVSVAER